MAADGQRVVTVQRAVLHKFTQAGELYEAVEMADGRPARVTFRRPGLAPGISYASGVPLAPGAMQED